MIFDIKERDGGMYATVSGRLDTPTSVEARSEIVPLLEELDCTRGSLIEHSGCLFQITKLYKS